MFINWDGGMLWCVDWGWVEGMDDWMMVLDLNVGGLGMEWGLEGI